MDGREFHEALNKDLEEYQERIAGLGNATSGVLNGGDGAADYLMSNWQNLVDEENNMLGVEGGDMGTLDNNK